MLFRSPYEFERKKLPIDILFGTDRIRRAIERDATLGVLERSWTPALLAFARRRARWLAYR